jgi:hypothetical protein
MLQITFNPLGHPEARRSRDPLRRKRLRVPPERRPRAAPQHRGDGAAQGRRRRVPRGPLEIHGRRKQLGTIGKII